MGLFVTPLLFSVVVAVVHLNLSVPNNTSKNTYDSHLWLIVYVSPTMSHGVFAIHVSPTMSHSVFAIYVSPTMSHSVFAI